MSAPLFFSLVAATRGSSSPRRARAASVPRSSMTNLTGGRALAYKLAY